MSGLEEKERSHQIRSSENRECSSRRRPQHNERSAWRLAWTLAPLVPGCGGPATGGLRGPAILLNPRREAVAAAAGGGGARSAAPRPGRSRGLQRSRAEPEPSPDALRPPAGSREPRPAGAPVVAARGAPRAGKRGGRGTRLGRRCRPAAGDGSRDRGLRDSAAQAGRARAGVRGPHPRGTGRRDLLLLPWEGGPSALPGQPGEIAAGHALSLPRWLWRRPPEVGKGSGT